MRNKVGGTIYIGLVHTRGVGAATGGGVGWGVGAPTLRRADRLDPEI